MMEIQIKKAIKSGNSSAVILPRSWLNKEVRVELTKKTPEIMLSDVIDILKKHMDLKLIIGVYLTGSYARGEEDEDSDIDILVITNGVDREIINEGSYSLLLVSSQLLAQKLGNDLFPIGQMLKEAKPLLNSYYLDLIEVKVTRDNVRWYLETTEEKLDMLKKVLDKTRIHGGKCISDRIAYTLILRLRTMEIIRRLIKNKNYSKKDFVRLIKGISGGINAYERYLDVKNNLKDKNGVSFEEAERLYEYLKNELTSVKKLVKSMNKRG